MRIALLTNNKNENRVFLTPNSVKQLCDNKYEVVVVNDCGKRIGYSNAQYLQAGAKICRNNIDAIKQADIVLKVSGVTTKEVSTIKTGAIIISNFNFCNNTQLLYKCINKHVTTLGIESFTENGLFPLIIANEQIKGRYGVVEAIKYLSTHKEHGVGKTFATLSQHDEKAHFVILNGSYAGVEAAKTAIALGSDVTILESDSYISSQISQSKSLLQMANLTGGKLQVVSSSYVDLKRYTSLADVVIATNSTPGSLTAKRITEEMVQHMRAGSVYVDLAIEQGISSDSQNRTKWYETRKKDIYVKHKITHIAHPNIPSLFAYSISNVMSNLITNIIIKHFNKPTVEDVIRNDEQIAIAITTYKGHITNSLISNTLSLENKNIKTLIK